jgi:hypothetical protein
MDDFRLAEMLIAVVARAGGVKVKRLKGRETQATISKLRDTARFLIRKKTSLSFPEIGKLFQGQDHSSVIAAVRREQMRLDRGLPHLPSGLTWSAWHDHILGLLGQDIAAVTAVAAGLKSEVV